MISFLYFSSYFSHIWITHQSSVTLSYRISVFNASYPRKKGFVLKFLCHSVINWFKMLLQDKSYNETTAEI